MVHEDIFIVDHILHLISLQDLELHIAFGNEQILFLKEGSLMGTH